MKNKMKANLPAALAALSVGVGAGVANAQSLSHMAPPHHSSQFNQRVAFAKMFPLPSCGRFALLTKSGKRAWL
jgi:hypothetical protein